MCPLETRFYARSCKRFAVDYFSSVLDHKMHVEAVLLFLSPNRGFEAWSLLA